MPDNPTGPDNPAANPSPGPADVTKEIETLRAELAEASKRYEGLRSLQDRRYQEFQQALQDPGSQPYNPPQGQGYNQSGYYPPAQPVQEQYAYQGYQTPQPQQAPSAAPLYQQQELEEVKRDNAQTRFLQSHPDALKPEKEGEPSIWDEMQRTAQDPALAASFTVRQQLRDGRVVTKYDDSYTRLYESIKGRRLEAQVAGLRQKAAELDKIRASNNNQALISGEGASAPIPEGLSMDQLKTEEDFRKDPTVLAYLQAKGYNP